jgi:hypothetical protein
MAQQIKITQTSNADMNIGVPKNLTAVEWFYQRIFANDIKEVFEQAKAMEKKQIINAWDTAYAVGGANGSNDWVNECELTDNSEYYYNQTYQSNKDKPDK